jgi:hypothetical protein
MLFLLIYTYNNLDTSFLSKLQCIRLQPQEYLHDPLFISNNSLFIRLPRYIKWTDIWNYSLHVTVFIIIHLIVVNVLESREEF